MPSKEDSPVLSRADSKCNEHGTPVFRVTSPDGLEVDGDEQSKPLFDEDTVVPLVELPPPPDGGWGWVICFSSFVLNLVLDGIAYTFGVLLEPLVSAFDSNRSTVSWVGSLLCGVYLMSGPIVGGLVNKFGCRPVCIAGSVIACAGLVLSTLSPNVPVLMLTYGVIGGIGLGLIYLPAVVAVGYYFERRRALATGISVCGSGVGTFLFAPLATFLVGEFGWKGANLIFAGLCLNCAVFGALLRPLELVAVKMPPVTEEERNEDEADLDEDDEDDEGNNFTVLLPDGTHHENVVSQPPLTPNSSFHSHQGIATVSTSVNLTALPTIEEQATITKQDEGKHKSIAEVFPDQPQKEATQQQQQQQPERRGSERRKRNTSESNASAKFQVTPLRSSFSRRGGGGGSNAMMTRNSTAPNFFVDPTLAIPRNSSTPGFGHLALLHGGATVGGGVGNETIYGIQGSQLLSNNTLNLQPSSGLSSRRNSRPTIRPLYRKDVFYAGSVSKLINESQQQQQQQQSHLKRKRSSGGMISALPSYANFDEYRHSVISIPRRRSSVWQHRGSIVASHLSIPRSVRRAGSLQAGDQSIIEEEGRGLQSFWDALSDLLNFRLLSNKFFLLIGISNIFGMLGFYTPFVYLPNLAVLNGVAVEDANFLLSIIGISNTLGRVAAGWFSDLSWVNPLVVTNLAILGSGVVTCAVPFCSGYAAYVVISVLFGLFVAAYISLSSVVLVNLLGLDNLTSAFGLLVLFRGASSMLGTPVAGSVYDATQSYNFSFFLSGGFLITAAAISEIADILYRIDQRRRSKEQDKECTDFAN